MTVASTPGVVGAPPAATPPTPPQAGEGSTPAAPAAGAALPNEGAPPAEGETMIEMPAAAAFRALGGKNVMVPQSAFKTIKTKAHSKGVAEGEALGRSAYEQEIQAKLKEAGFDNLDSVLSLTKGLSGSPPTGQLTSTQVQDPPSDTSTHPAPLNTAWQQEQYKLRQQVQAADAARQAAEALLEQQQAEMRVREGFARQGVRDIDYATHLLGQHVAALPEAEVMAFDTNAWLGEQRAARPYLFGDAPAAPTTPATTGPTNTGTTAAPTAAVVATNTSAPAFDARTATKAELSAHLQSLGIDYPGY